MTDQPLSHTAIRDRLNNIGRLARVLGMAAAGSDAEDSERDALETMASHIAAMLRELSDDLQGERQEVGQ